MNLNPKVRNILIAAIGGDAASVIASLSGTLTWTATILTVVASVSAVAIGYFTSQGDWTPQPPV